MMFGPKVHKAGLKVKIGLFYNFITLKFFLQQYGNKNNFIKGMVREKRFHLSLWRNLRKRKRIFRSVTASLRVYYSLFLYS